MNLPELKNCPFCGGEAKYVEGLNNRCTGHGESSDDAGVRCCDCGIGIVESSYAGYQIEIRQSKCAEKWNARIS